MRGILVVKGSLLVLHRGALRTRPNIYDGFLKMFDRLLNTSLQHLEKFKTILPSLQELGFLKHLDF